MANVFISSSKDTLEVARKLASELQSHGFELTLPVRDAKPGIEFSSAVIDSVSACDAFLVIIGPKVERSAAQEREWLAILDEASDFSKNKKLIPLTVGQAELPNFLKNWESLAVPGDRQQWSKLIDTIVRALRSDSKPKFVPVEKADLKQWQHRRDSIAAIARELKASGH